jgi:hypothetical protein
MAGTTGLEPATSAVTGQHSNQLNYVPFFQLLAAHLWLAIYCSFASNVSIEYIQF